MKATARFDARGVRDTLLGQGAGRMRAGFVRYAYRPFDIRWLYWEKDTKLLDEKRADYKPHVFEGNVWIEAREREAKEDFSRGTCSASTLQTILATDFRVSFPCLVEGRRYLEAMATALRRPNLSGSRRSATSISLGLGVEDLFHHVLNTILHDPALPRGQRRSAQDGAGPASPFPAGPTVTPKEEQTDALARISRAQGRELAHAARSRISPVPGVTEAPLRPEDRRPRRSLHHQTGATWPETISPSPPAGGITAKATR